MRNPLRYCKPVLILSTLWLLGFQAIATVSIITVSPELIKTVHAEYGQPASLRVINWNDILQNNHELALMPTLELVNNFFNQVTYHTDLQHWQKEDYWATPVEMLATDGGDCEDYSIAKYFTLRALGVPDSDMRITYVTAKNINQAHMVLSYFGENRANPWVLDNLTEEIKPASERTDLKPVYSFNAESLWLSKERGKGEFMGSSMQLIQWSNMLTRLSSSNIKRN